MKHKDKKGHPGAVRQNDGEAPQQKPEPLYKTLVENSLTGVTIVQDGKYVFVNQRFAEMHGYKPEEMMGRQTLQVIHPDDREALKQRRIAGAAFDIYHTHPLPLHSPLLDLDNVVLTPHVGGATDGTVERYSRTMTEDIERFLEGKRPQNLINPQAWRDYAG